MGWTPSVTVEVIQRLSISIDKRNYWFHMIE